MFPSDGINCLHGNNYFTNENISIKYGLELSAFLGYLISADKFFSHNGSGPWFYQTIEEVERRTGFKKKKQERLIKQLENLGIVERKYKGMPPKRYFLIHYERIDELTSSNEELETSLTNRSKETILWSKNNYNMGQKEPIYGPKRADIWAKKSHNNNIYNNNIYKEKENIKEKESIRSSSKNTLPISETSKNVETSKKASKEKENKNNVLIEEIVSYLNQRANKHFKSKNNQTIKLISGRISEGYKLEDFKAVIDNRVEKWLNDEKMSEYLRPSTLFRPSNFEAYFNDALASKEKVTSKKEQEFIEKFRGFVTPPNLPPKQALEQFKKEHEIIFMTDDDFMIFESWYKIKIEEWSKKLDEKLKRVKVVEMNGRTKNKANE